MTPDVAVRRAVAEYFAGQRTVEWLHEYVAGALANVPPEGQGVDLVHQVYGLLTDQHAGLRSADDVREALHQIVTTYFGVWNLMAPSAPTVSSSSYLFMPPDPVQRPSLRVFDRLPAEVSA